MGQTTNKIERHIEHTRGALGSNLQELENKVKSVTDWKQHFQNNPMTMLGVAFGGGILLSTMLAGSKHKRKERDTDCAPHPGTDHQKIRALETWDNIKGALIGVAATRFKDFVGEIVPGFQEQFQQTEEKLRTMRSA